MTDDKTMWETEILCAACEGTHLLSSPLIPRVFEYVCPVNERRVGVPFRDPSRMPEPWAEVPATSPGAVPILVAEVHGKFEV